MLSSDSEGVSRHLTAWSECTMHCLLVCVVMKNSSVGIIAALLRQLTSTAVDAVCNVLQVLQSADGMWQANSGTAAVTYTSTIHSGVSYRPSTASIRPSTASNRSSTASNRPSTASNRPSTAYPSSLTAAPGSQQARPASAQESSGRRSVAALAGGSRGKTSMLLGTSVVLPADNTHLQITKMLQSKGFRSVSPLSEGSTGATPSPAQTPCSVLSRPTTAGRGNTHASLGPLFGYSHVSLCSCLGPCVASSLLLSGSARFQQTFIVLKHLMKGSQAGFDYSHALAYYLCLELFSANWSVQSLCCQQATEGATSQPEKHLMQQRLVTVCCGTNLQHSIVFANANHTIGRQGAGDQKR